ncbi:MAG: hypothetical protein CBD18_01325 [Opitutales bacterium TMED158]|nr:MAG: hypothetical protein CBD18_01325 [Opitutales bacterium TMED158]
MEPEERRRKTWRSIIASVITSTVLAILTYFALPDMKPAFYLLIWFGAFFVWWMWTMMATHY